MQQQQQQQPPTQHPTPKTEAAAAAATHTNTHSFQCQERVKAALSERPLCGFHCGTRNLSFVRNVALRPHVCTVFPVVASGAALVSHLNVCDVVVVVVVVGVLSSSCVATSLRPSTSRSPATALESATPYSSNGTSKAATVATHAAAESSGKPAATNENVK
ncbi:uncharacterized protein LOC108162017 [Drosophila miranda]|uniref:uncharacterized protein LOC108162017 n=1 Tax=Drosophila miranda TaxID=7229 RepID=UPI0007E7C0E9|nr:uncharacterized protein LOC108162017 [Drosophila miranda]